MYRANTEEMKRVRNFLEEYWLDSLDRLRDVAETAEREKGNTNG